MVSAQDGSPISIAPDATRHFPAEPHELHGVYTNGHLPLKENDIHVNGNGHSIALPISSSDTVFGPNDKGRGKYEMLNQPLGATRPLKIIYLGGGASGAHPLVHVPTSSTHLTRVAFAAGLNFAYKVKTHLKNVTLVAYEKNSGLTGTCESKHAILTCSNAEDYRQGSRISTPAVAVISQVTPIVSPGPCIPSGIASTLNLTDVQEIQLMILTITTATPLPMISKNTWRR
jgi:hypothetical protein